jgi:hypothetical protein
MPMVAESTFELAFARIAVVMSDFKVQIWRPSELHFLLQNGFLWL